MPVRLWLLRRWWLVLGLLLLTVVPRLLWLDQLWGGDYDLGICRNLCWNLAEGRGFWSDVLGRNHLGEHASPIMALFAPLYAIAPSAVWLVVAQGLAMAAIVLAALWIAEARLATVADARWRRWGWWVLLVLTLGYAPLWSAWWWDPQPVVYGAAGLAWAMVAVERRRWWAMWLGLALLLASRESAALAGLGLAWWAWRHDAGRRIAITVAVLSLVWAAVAMFWLMPSMRDGAAWGHLARLDPLAEPDTKLLYLLRLVGQLGFLPLVDPLAALAALPGVLLNLVTSHPPQMASGFHYDAQIAPFLLAAAAGGLARLAACRSLPSRWLPGLGVLVAIGWGALPPLRHVFSLCDPVRQTAASCTRDDLERATATIPTDEAVAADPQLGPLLCLRRGYRTLRGPGDDGDPALIRALPVGTRIIVQRWWWLAQLKRDPELEPQVGPALYYGPCVMVFRRTAAAP
jgi:hypothetical protein